MRSPHPPIIAACNTPATAAELDSYLVGGTLTPIKVAAGQSATYTCNDNFSLENFATTNERVTETIACSADGGVTTVLKPTAACAGELHVYTSCYVLFHIHTTLPCFRLCSTGSNGQCHTRCHQ